MSGIHSALMNSTTDKVLCIACDMPLITSETLNILGNYNEEYEVLIPEVSEGYSHYVQYIQKEHS